MTKQHQGNTKTYDELKPKEKALSINGQIRSIELSIHNHVGKDKAIADKCIAQLSRLIDRLKLKYP